MSSAPACSLLSLFPLDPRCHLLTNLVWTPAVRSEGAEATDTVPSLHRQHLWVKFPGPVATRAILARFHSPVGRVCVETAEDDAGRSWRLLAEGRLDQSPATLRWDETTVTNLRVRVADPVSSAFPQAYVYAALELDMNPEGIAKWPVAPLTVPVRVLSDRSPERVEPFAGAAPVPLNQQLGLCHDRPRTDRCESRFTEDGIEFETPLLRVEFSRRHALMTRLGWDTHAQGRRDHNLLSTGQCRGAFPVTERDGRRVSCEASRGTFAVDGRHVEYRGITTVPEIEWSYQYRLREKGFALEIGWECSRTFQTSELAALRLPFDLYRSVVNVLAMPDPRGPAGLVTLPLVINAPNHGVLRVTASGGQVSARILPLRVQGELWLDLIPGAVPLPSGVLEMPEGKGSVTLEFELTRIFPFGVPDQRDLFGWWELPPFYSFVEAEPMLGPLMDSWLNGLAFRPDVGRFANNSVADAVSMCANYYADIAAYSPRLADGLDSRDFIRFAAEQMALDRDSVYSSPAHFPSAATSPIDCAWLYVASTGDWAWAKRWLPTLRYYAAVLKKIEHNGTGLIASEQSGIPEEAEAQGVSGSMHSQWADGVRSGHLESYTNAHAYRALLRAGDLFAGLELSTEAATVRGQAERLAKNFLPTFFDAETRRIVQWVARDGCRFGFDSHMHLGAAIALGLVPDELARELLREYFDRLHATGFSHFEWGLPIFLEPIPPFCHNNWPGKGVEPDGSDQIGNYQNGAVHTHQTWYILQALYRSGLRREANDLFSKMTTLVRRGELCGGLHSGIDWRNPVDGRPAGYEGLLAEQFHFLLAAITGYLGCELTIDGLAINGPATGRIKLLKPNFARLAG